MVTNFDEVNGAKYGYKSKTHYTGITAKITPSKFFFLNDGERYCIWEHILWVTTISNIASDPQLGIFARRSCHYMQFYSLGFIHRTQAGFYVSR